MSKSSLKVKKYIHSKTTGPIYGIRKIHGKLYALKIQIMYNLFRTQRKRNKVVATAFGGKTYGDNPAFILEKIHKQFPNAELVWLKLEENDYQCPEFIRVVQFHNLNDMIKEVATSSVVIDNEKFFCWMTNYRNQFLIHTWHGGLGIKKIELDEASRSKSNLNNSASKKQNHVYDFYISNSDHLTKVYRSAFRYDGLVWKVGYPIEDELQIVNNERQIIRDRFDIPAKTKIILYAPTFRGLYNWNSSIHVAQIVETFERRFGEKWVMVVHWHHYVKKENRVLQGAIDVTDYNNFQELIKASDAFISDYSSSIFQAVQCNIPCYIYVDDYQEYKDDRDWYYSFDELPFPYAFTNDELTNIIENYDEKLWKDKWLDFQKRMGHVVTGHSADDIAKVCVDFLNGKSKEEIMKDIPFETKY